MLYVLAGTGVATSTASAATLEPGTAVWLGAGPPSRSTRRKASSCSRCSSTTRCPPNGSGHAVVARRGRQGRRRDRRSAVQHPRDARARLRLGDAVRRLHPAVRAPDHFHHYDEVLYVLAGRGPLHIDGETEPLRPGPASTCRPVSSTASRTPATTRCTCSASSARPARPPRPTTRTARRLQY